MENYFNYFTEIEEHFQRQRGSLTLLSPLDWSLIESFQSAGILLETVLKGIDLAFDKHARRKGITRKINSLAYCTQAILKEHERLRDAAVGTSSSSKEKARTESDESDKQNLVMMLQKATAQLQNSLGQTCIRERRVLFETLSDVARSLEVIGSEVTSSQSINYEELESRLSFFEEKVLASLVTSLDDQRLMTLRTEVNQEINRHRRHLRAEQISLIEKKLIQKKLLDQFGLPRLSLFYLPLN
jgi:hypothetical protein